MVVDGPAAPQQDQGLEPAATAEERLPMTVIRAAITQVAWTGDKESMIARHEKLTRDAAGDGAQVIGYQELFYGPYFGIVQDQKYYSYVESIPGPTVERFQALAKELGIVIDSADL